MGTDFLAAVIVANPIGLCVAGRAVGRGMVSAVSVAIEMNELTGLLRQLDGVVRQRRQARRREWLLRSVGLLLGGLIVLAWADIAWNLSLSSRLLATFVVMPAVI